MLEMVEIANQVRDANPQRVADNLDRRAIKLIEEIGEVAQAWLNVTSASNGKMKTWDDVREEIADCLIVALDIAFTVLPGEASAPAPVLLCDTVGVAGIDQDDFITLIFAATFHLSMVGQSFARKQFALVRIHSRRVVEQMIGLALLALPDQAGIAQRQIVAQLVAEVRGKLDKWSRNRAAMMVVTDDV